MRCSRCRRWIENAREIKFAREGWLGVPLCPKCKAIIEEESRNKYRRGRAKRYPGDPYETDIYRSRPIE